MKSTREYLFALCVLLWAAGAQDLWLLVFGLTFLHAFADRSRFTVTESGLVAISKGMKLHASFDPSG